MSQGKQRCRELISELDPDREVTDEEIEGMMNLGYDLRDKVELNEVKAFLRYWRPNVETIPVRSALLIIDVQNDFIDGALANPFHAEEIVPRINGIRDMFDFVVISMDWHPMHHCSFVESANEGMIDSLKKRDEEYKLFMANM